jgi:hypothetical protein
LLVLLESVKIEEKWRSSAPFVRSSMTASTMCAS